MVLTGVTPLAVLNVKILSARTSVCFAILNVAAKNMHLRSIQPGACVVPACELHEDPAHSFGTPNPFPGATKIEAVIFRRG